MKNGTGNQKERAMDRKDTAAARKAAEGRAAEAGVKLAGQYHTDPWGYAGVEVRFVPVALVPGEFALRSARGLIATGDRMALWSFAELSHFAVAGV